MKIDELIKYYEYQIAHPQNGAPNGYDERDLMALKIALAALKAHKRGFRMCEFKETCSDWSCDYRPVQTELDEILGGLE